MTESQIQNAVNLLKSGRTQSQVARDLSEKRWKIVRIASCLKLGLSPSEYKRVEWAVQQNTIFESGEFASDRQSGAWDVSRGAYLLRFPMTAWADNYLNVWPKGSVNA